MAGIIIIIICAPRGSRKRYDAAGDTVIAWKLFTERTSGFYKRDLPLLASIYIGFVRKIAKKESPKKSAH